MKNTVHFVRFLYPGSFVAESSEKEVKSRDPKELDVPDRCDGFYFFDRSLNEEDGEKLWGKERNVSPTTYFGTEMTLADVRRSMPDADILISNMENNGYARVVKSPHGQFFPLRDGDLVISSPKDLT